MLNKADNDHAACARLFATYPGRLVVPGPAGEFELESVASADLRRMAGLVRTYADCPLGAADASVVAIAERLGATRVATLDHRHFQAVRPVHCPAFELLPAA